MSNIVMDGNTEDAGDIKGYSMHVSSRYLELTKNKLQLTRLPREPRLPEERRWEFGTPKAVLEPLLDYWLEKYDWRAQETIFNKTLPQYRTTIRLPISSSIPPENPNYTPSPISSEALRIHFVHKPSKHKSAIPLLICYAWPTSFIELHKIIDALTDPQSLLSYGVGAQQAFHVVAPSIPGSGFSDGSTTEIFGLRETAAVFDGVMQRLGYDKYVVHGVGWGFKICRALSIYHPQACLAMHTANPSFEEPEMRKAPVTYLKYRLAKLTRACIPAFSFGYVPSEVDPWRSKHSKLASSLPFAEENNVLETALGLQYTSRPQTLAYSLCDSPIGLLSTLLDAVHTRSHTTSPTPSRSRSPFLSPSELELQERTHATTTADGSANPIPNPAGTQDNDVILETIEEEDGVMSPRESEINAKDYTWTPTELLNWTMMHWLPGPEAALRWLRQARLDSGPGTDLSSNYSPVPLGISSFRTSPSPSLPSSSVKQQNAGPRRNIGPGASTSPVMWGAAIHKIAWVKRHARPARFPGWEAPDLLVLDLRECFGAMLEAREIEFLPNAEV